MVVDHCVQEATHMNMAMKSVFDMLRKVKIAGLEGLLDGSKYDTFDPDLKISYLKERLLPAVEKDLKESETELAGWIQEAIDDVRTRTEGEFPNTEDRRHAITMRRKLSIRCKLLRKFQSIIEREIIILSDSK